MSRSRLDVWRLGTVEYADGLQLQAAFGRARAEGSSPDVLLLLEHPPVLTLGRGAKPENVVASAETLAAEGVQVHETNRGGDVTYHGPGQIVGYPILKLPPGRQDVRRYVRDVEETLIRALARFGVAAHREERWPGVWTHEPAPPGGGAPSLAKIGALGVHLSRWQTSHGFALNVNTRLEHFGLIVPCGIREAGVTSLQRMLGREVPLGSVEDALVDAFAQLFDAEVSERRPGRRTVAVAVVRPDGRVLCLQRSPERGGFWQLVTGGVEAGESPAAAAARELSEETGLGGVEPVSLGYRHAFALGETLPPDVCEESAFAVAWPAGREVLLSPEHARFEWLPVEEAEARLPFVGLKVVARRAVTLLGG